MSVDSTNPVAPYTNWQTAAQIIQDAIDVSTNGDTVLVTNGVYDTGGRVVIGGMTNRVAIAYGITVQSVNGPNVTIIQGKGPSGNGAVRCAYVGIGAVLSGFTLTNGHTLTNSSNEDTFGGGVFSARSAVVFNCIITANTAGFYGGGAYCSPSDGATLNSCTIARNSAKYGGGAFYGTLNNCTLTDNSADGGGGVQQATLNNCTLTGNSAGYGGGAYSSTLNNCLLYYNMAHDGPNYSGGTLLHCCTVPDPGGTGNITNEPRLVAASHIAADSACVGKGTNSCTSGVDIDGEPWRSPPSIGADEPHEVAATGGMSVAIGVTVTNVTAGYDLPLRALIDGRSTRCAWEFGDGTALTNQPYAAHAWSSAGTYAVVLTAWNADHPEGVACTTVVSVVERPIHYADVSNPTPAYPYTNWATAATSIQDAIDAGKTPGRLVLVADGVYDVGGRAVYGAMTNRVALVNGVTVRSVNGPAVTVIRGQGPVGNGAVRCAYVGTNAVLSGFTVTNGCTRTTGDQYKELSGGGTWCEVSAVVSNCILAGNSADRGGGTSGGTLNNCTLTSNSAGGFFTMGFGGGAYLGTLNNCTLTGNSAGGEGGGAYISTLNNCTLIGNSSGFSGGGVSRGTLDRCTLSGNSAGDGGGGAYYGTLNNCVLTGNSAGDGGGGAHGSTLNNCTLTGNSAAGDGGGGAYYGTLNNCLVYYNSAEVGPNSTGGTLRHCCTTPDPGGMGNITDEPRLASASHIAAASPCVGRGRTDYVSGADIDGEPWRAQPSIGADEPYPGSSTGFLSVAIGAAVTNAAAGYGLAFRALVGGSATGNVWDFGDGTRLTNRVWDVAHQWSATGTYAVVLTAWNGDHPSGVSCTTIVSIVDQPIYYADVSNPTPAYPYTNWATAATSIQDAIDAGNMPGRLVLVADGVYETGGKAVYGAMTNRVALSDGVVVRSLSGPAATVIKGKGPLGNGPVRCAYVGTNALLSGFTLTNGCTRMTGDSSRERSGGGVWCEVSAVVSNCILAGNSADLGGGTSGGTLNNCVLTGNSAGGYGGGAYRSTLDGCALVGNSAVSGAGGACLGTLNKCVLTSNSVSTSTGSGGAVGQATLNRCALSGNSAPDRGGGAAGGTLNNCVLTGNSAGNYGGGASGGTLNNCTIIANSASIAAGGGAYSSTLNNCIVYYNTAPLDPNCSGGTLRQCCTTPDPGGLGNITDEPGLVSASHIAADSPCVGRGGTNYVSGSDIDGEPWRAPPSIGADEPYAGSATGELTAAIRAPFISVTAGYELTLEALTGGRATRNAWDFGDGTGLTNRAYAAHAWSSTGTYAVVLTAWNADHPEGVACTAVVSVVERPIHYADVSNPTPAYPYTNWATAATSIQDAIDAGKTPGRLVLVADGVYDAGGRAVYGTMTNRVALTDGVTLRSVNGPAATVIRGEGPSGPGAVRCAYVAADAALEGFTLTNGCTRTIGDALRDRSGGGAWCELSGVMSNCILVGNSAANLGGGVCFGILSDCSLTGNTAPYGGGAYAGILSKCTLNKNFGDTGGGGYRGVFYNCDIFENYAASGGGAAGNTLTNCRLTKNTANSGGGAYGGALNNCTVVDNSAGSDGGGVIGGKLVNCIVYHNLALIYPNHYNSALSYCCTWPGSGVGCITNAPVFVAPDLGDYRLAPTSWCIDAGINQDWMFTATDRDGNPRVINGMVDMGACETPFMLRLSGLLQGPYRTNSHAMAAGDPANIPLTSPYATDPKTVSSIPSNGVDWVLVELVGTNGSTVVSKSAFLDTGGQLLAADGAGGITAEVSAGYYSVVLKHRNHLAAMSPVPLAFTNILTTYDFTAGADKYSGGAAAAVELEPGVWGLIAGDVDGDGAVLGADSGIYSNQVGQTGYRRADLNLDGTVDGDDLALWTANAGRQSGASAAGTPLAGGLAISPQRKTVLCGATFTLAALNTTNSVNWAFVANPSGGSLSPSTSTSAVYTAGPVSNCVDIVQAQDGDRLGRAWVNVISSNDVAGAGRAIVIAGGKGPSDPLGPVTDYLGDLAYNTLLYRGYAKDNVRYLNPETDQDVDGNGAFDDVAAATTMAAAAGTFTNWAMAGTDRLFVYLVDHGGTASGEGYFRLNGEETLTAVQFDAWLDQIQDARGNEMVVVLDFCEAGSFLEPLKRAGRTVIAACGAGEPTYFVAGGLVSFSDAFFGAVVSGQDLAGAFGLARDAMSSYQGALADADGSGGYAPSVDPPLMAGVYLGPSFIAGKDIPQVGHVMGGQLLQGDTAATLWAYDIVSAYPLDRVWCMVVPPGHDPDPQNPVADLPLLDLAYNATTGRYEARYAGFTELGTYKLLYYARDIWGSVSLPRPSFVEQAGYGERMIVVAGGSTNDAQWSAVSRLAAWTYQTALARRLGKPALRYLSSGPAQDIDGDGTNDVHAAATLANLAEAITLWPTNAHRLNVYLLGSSTTNGQCRLNPTESLRATQLDGWLDAFQASNTAAVVVLDFDGCGSYVPELKPPAERERIVVASTKAGSSRLCALDGVYSFSRFFLSGIFNGKSVGAAFAFARDAIKQASGKLRQAPQLDDNGNGVPDQKNLDGLVASQRYLGAAFATGAEAPFIGSVGPTGMVVVGEPQTLWADPVLADAGISNVWCAISPPDYDGIGDPPRLDLQTNAATGRYEATTNFALPGEYALTFFALDNEGQLSAPMQSLLTAADPFEPDDAPGNAGIFPVGQAQLRNIHAAGNEDWVLFYAPTGQVFEVKATQLGTNTDLVLDLYYELPDGGLGPVYEEPANDHGTGSNLTEFLALDLKLNPFDLEPGIYLLRIGCADTNLFGPGSDYRLEIYEPTGNSGGTITILARGLPGVKQGPFYVSFSPSNAPAAGAAWRIEEIGGSWRSDTNLYSLWVTDAKTWHIEFRDAAGFTAPADRALNLQADKTINVPAAYAPIFSYTNPVPELVSLSLGAGGVFQFQCLAAPGNYYAIEQSTNLIHWVPLGTNLVPSDGALPFSITNDPHQPRAFYRWRLIE